MKYNKINLLFLVVGLAFILFFVLDLIIGNVVIPLRELQQMLSFGTKQSSSVFTVIFFEMRLPKALSAILVGAGLSVSGIFMQSLFRNPLAGPFTLGVSSGASLGVALFVMSGAFSGSLFISWLGMSVSAIIGAFLILSIVLLISYRVSDGVSLLIIGIMLGSLTTAIISILQYFSQAEELQNFIVWTFGSLSGITWQQLKILAPIVLFTCLFSLMLAKPLNALLLSDNYANSIGVNVKQIRFFIIVISGVLAGIITAFAGPIAFIGIAVPHLARNIFQTTNHRILIPAVLLLGSLIMLICDMISQLPIFTGPIPINSVTSLFGAPVVIWVIFRNKRLKGGRE